MDSNSTEAFGPGITPSTLSRELVLWLLERQWSPQRLRTGVDGLGELEQQCLEEVIQLREQGKPEVSLGLIEVGQGLGLQSPWLDDNRARALLLLGEEEAARAIWQALEAHPDPAVATEAKAMVIQGSTDEPAPEEPPHCAALIELVETSGHGAQRLRAAGPSPEEQESACLEEVIFLREKGNPQLSLELITAAQEMGFSSPWLRDNKARALVELNRKQEAISIWQELSSSPDEACAAMAADMVTLLRNSLLEPLREECGRRSWLPLHLQASEAETAAPLECALREVIASREGGQAELSLALVERCLQLGWSSPWLRDNQARALVHLDRIEEAAAIWSELSRSEDPGLAAMAQDMLSLYGEEAEKRRLEREVQIRLHNGEAASAKELILERLLEQPNHPKLRELLVDVLAKLQPDSAESTPLLQQELREPTLRLEAHACLLGALERELQGDPAAITPF